MAARFALVNPNWTFTGSTYFGCQEPHFPLELLFARDKIIEAGHEALLIDAQISNLSVEEVKRRVERFAPDYLVIPTAPSYLFWRCPQPELRVPREWFDGITNSLAKKPLKVAIGPHPSATPSATLRKLNCDIAMRGEPDATLSQLPSVPWEEIDGCCWRHSAGQERISASLGVVQMKSLSALDFRDYPVELHSHRHHVFNGKGRGAELEFARGCPWACTFCNKTLFRNSYREREVSTVLEEVDRMIERGVDYIYFIDEIFGVGKNVIKLLEGIAERNVTIGFQSRIDLWNEETLELLGRARCISFECGIESVTEQGRDELNKNCRMDTERLSELLIYARQHIPWVQANLILNEHDDREQIRQWQARMKAHGVWVSEPVPMFPFPGSPLYQKTFGAPPDDSAWEHAHRYYRSKFDDKGYSDIQEQRPAMIEELENAG
jgi:B12-binding domain/radical SAM domain protein of rhizo-twelve system